MPYRSIDLHACRYLKEPMLRETINTGALCQANQSNSDTLTIHILAYEKNSLEERLAIMVVKAEKPINCTVVGDAMVGKSAMVKAFVDNTKPESSYVATTVEHHEGMYFIYLI